MKNEDETVAAFEVLWRNAETDFEKHRIKSLLTDLAYGEPSIQQIDDEHCKFNGATYKLNKNGHYWRSTSLHRDVWEYHNGAIPDGKFVIHHKNLNPQDNDIDNLQLLTVGEHRGIHNQVPTVLHCEYCGKEFKSYLGGRFCSDKCRRIATAKYTLVCEHCGKTFKHRRKTKKFCSQECYFEHLKIDTSAMQKRKIFKCLHCGKEFEDVQSSKRKYCSSECANLAHRKTEAEKVPKYRIGHCIVCGKEFKTRRYRKTETCSRKCASRLGGMTRRLKKFET